MVGCSRDETRKNARIIRDNIRTKKAEEKELARKMKAKENLKKKFENHFRHKQKYHKI